MGLQTHGTSIIRRIRKGWKEDFRSVQAIRIICIYFLQTNVELKLKEKLETHLQTIDAYHRHFMNNFGDIKPVNVRTTLYTVS